MSQRETTTPLIWNHAKKKCALAGERTRVAALDQRSAMLRAVSCYVRVSRDGVAPMHARVMRHASLERRWCVEAMFSAASNPQFAPAFIIRKSKQIPVSVDHPVTLEQLDVIDICSMRFIYVGKLWRARARENLTCSIDTQQPANIDEIPVVDRMTKDVPTQGNASTRTSLSKSETAPIGASKTRKSLPLPSATTATTPSTRAPLPTPATATTPNKTGAVSRTSAASDLLPPAAALSPGKSPKKQRPRRASMLPLAHVSCS
jgi:hypothetical protein